MIIETKLGKLPVRYGWSALAKFGDLSGMKMDDILELDLTKMNISDLLNFILVGFMDGARKDGIECQLKNIDEVGDLLDEDPKLIDKIMKAFSEMAGEAGEESKKK